LKTDTPKAAPTLPVEVRARKKEDEANNWIFPVPKEKKAVEEGTMQKSPKRRGEVLSSTSAKPLTGGTIA